MESLHITLTGYGIDSMVCCMPFYALNSGDVDQFHVESLLIILILSFLQFPFPFEKELSCTATMHCSSISGSSSSNKR